MLRGGWAEAGFSDALLLMREQASLVAVAAAAAAAAVRYEREKDPSRIPLLRCRKFHLHLELW